MSARLLLLVAVLAAFSVITVLALINVGYIGIFTTNLDNWAGIQVLIDLIIIAALACIWMIADARKRGVSPWPFVLITVFAGSFGPLLYLVVREVRTSSRPHAFDRALS